MPELRLEEERQEHGRALAHRSLSIGHAQEAEGVMNRSLCIRDKCPSSNSTQLELIRICKFYYDIVEYFCRYFYLLGLLTFLLHGADLGHEADALGLRYLYGTL